MSRFVALVAAFAVCSCAFGQNVSFECYPIGSLPNDPAAGCEGVASNNLGFGTGVSSTTSCGFPTAGLQYANIFANGPIAVPTGGPFPRPAPNTVTEVRVPIPTGASSISFDWEFFNHECPTTQFYDGMSIDLVDAGGNFLLNLAFADTLLTEAVCTQAGLDYCQGPISEVVPAGPNGVFAGLGAYPACSYISIVVWNGTDNAVPSQAYVDNIQFDSAVSGCPVPCFILGAQPPALVFSSPSGAGCLLVSMTNLLTGGQYFLPVTLNPGTFPNGWLYGVDIGFPELASEINTGFPFQGAVIGSACSTGSATIGQFCGLPSGLTLYAVALGFAPGSSYPSVNTPAVSYTIP